MIKHVVSNFILSKLPVHVVASHVMPLLDLRDLVTLDSARAMNGGGLLQEVQSLMPPLRLPHELDRFVAEWFLSHGYRLNGSVIHSWDTHDVTEKFSHKFHDVSLCLPRDFWATAKLLRRCTHVYITHPLNSDQIAEVFMNARNVRIFSMTGEAAEAHPELIAQFPKLDTLSCSCKSLHTALPSLAVMGTKLKELSLNEFAADIAVEVFAQVAVLCPNLEHIDIADFSRTKNRPSVDAVIIAFAEHCHSLRKVSIDFCQMSATALRRLLCQCRKLNSITGLCDQWSAADILTFVECDARLDSIRLNYPLLGTLKAYTTLFAHLKSVDLGRGFLLSPNAVAAVSCMRALEQVYFYPEVAVGAGAADISAVLHAVAGTCRQLRKLTCDGSYVADLNFAAAVAAVLTNNSRIASVELSSHHLPVTPMPQVLADALATCRSLRYFVLESYNVTDNQMLPIIASLRWLKFLTLYAATGLTDVFLAALARHCHDLSWLRVTSSALLTESGLLELIKRCPKLTELGVHRNNMSAATAAALNAGRRLYKLEVVVHR
jgi:Leucine-rich repeat (LRR) protein